VGHYVTDLEQVLIRGDREARESGLGAMDALHVAAAVLAGATELITDEKPDKSIHRTQSIKVISIYSL
jgi:predicted nucleic acid-binding protein